ncbi:hypothetical protein [Lysobacter gummosus]
MGSLLGACTGARRSEPKASGLKLPPTKDFGASVATMLTTAITARDGLS